MKHFSTIALWALIFLAFIACSEDKEQKQPPRNLYTVTFDADGGTPVPEPQRIEEGKTVTAPATNPTKTGNVFIFWSHDKTQAYDFQTPVKNNLTLYAKWSPESAVEYWNITWELNGGAWPPNGNHPNKAPKNGTLNEPLTPTKTNHNFSGWHKDDKLTQKVSFPYNLKNITSDFTLYAKWTSSSPTPGDLKLDKTSLTLHTTDRVQLSATANPENLSWGTSDKNVAKVDKNGVITATGAGTATITASSNGKTATCAVTVNYAVFAVGKNENNKLSLWKNGKELKLSDTTLEPTLNSSVFVHNGWIYITGSKKNGDEIDLYLLKIQAPLQNEIWEAESIKMERKGLKTFSRSLFIDNENIYVAGCEILKRPNFQETYQRAVLWKNAKMQLLSDNEMGEAEARAIFVADNTTYVAGNDSHSNAVIWKNAKAEDLKDPENSIKTKAYDIFIAGKDIYIAGEAYYENKPIDTSKAVLWKNNTPTVLDTLGLASAVFVSGNNLYLATIGATATIWKNNQKLPFSIKKYINALYVHDNKVYAVNDDGLWIDGIKQTWGTNEFDSVFIK